MRYYLEHTPIQEYWVGQRKVFVKRDDLYGKPPAPPLGKLRGLRRILQQEYWRGARLVGCWDTRVSKLGLGVAVACLSHRNLRCLLGFPVRLDEGPPPQLREAQMLGAELLPLKPNHIDVCFGQTRRTVISRGGIMLPFGLESEEAVEAVAEEASRTPAEVTRAGTLLLCCGSGVTLAGLLRGLKVRPGRVVGVSSGRSTQRIQRCLERYINPLPTGLQLVPAFAPYAAESSASCPFPAHRNYDRKAWQYLAEHIDEYPEPILFWNIGA